LTLAPFTTGTLRRDGDTDVVAEVTDCFGTVQRFTFRRDADGYALVDAAVVVPEGLRVPFLDDEVQ
jgi:hypothetical protein